MSTKEYWNQFLKTGKRDGNRPSLSWNRTTTLTSYALSQSPNTIRLRNSAFPSLRRPHPRSTGTSANCTRRQQASRKLSEMRNENPTELSRRDCLWPRRSIPVFYGLLQTWGVYIEFYRSYFGNQAIKYLQTRTKGGVVVVAPNFEGSLPIPLLHLGLHLDTASPTLKGILRTTKSSCSRDTKMSLFPLPSHGARLLVPSGKKTCNVHWRGGGISSSKSFVCRRTVCSPSFFQIRYSLESSAM